MQSGRRRRYRHPSECGNALTVVVPLRASSESLASLRAVLAEIGRDPAANAILPLGQSPSTHFARFVIVEGAGAAPVLAFESNHDGGPDEYLRELDALPGGGLRRIYAHADPAPGKNLPGFLATCSLDYEAFYRAYPGRSVSDVLFALEIRDLVQRFLDENRRALVGLGPVQIHARVRAMLADRGIRDVSFEPVRPLRLSFLTDALQAIVGPAGPARDRAWWIVGPLLAAVPLALLGLELAFGDALRHLPAIALAFAVAVAVAVYAAIRRVEALVDAPPRPAPLFANDVLVAQEDFVVQNQLTHLAVLKPGRLRRFLVRSALATVNLLARISFVEGNLGGIPSIHFARWVLLDERRLIFFSNFDGTWDSYLGDFIDKASAGLSSIWSNTMWFPTTELLVGKGAQDAEAFKRWARERQLPTQVWYTAYPRYSVQNIRGAFVCAELATTDVGPAQAAAWLNELC